MVVKKRDLFLVLQVVLGALVVPLRHLFLEYPGFLWGQVDPVVQMNLAVRELQMDLWVPGHPECLELQLLLVDLQDPSPLVDPKMVDITNKLIL